MEIQGKIEYVGPEIQVSESFKKRELVVNTDEQYSQPLLIDFAQDKCEYLDLYKAGDDVIVKINLRGRKWVNPQGETKYFNQISGWQISRRQIQGPTQTATPPQANTQQFAPATTNEDDGDGDLPF